MIYLIDIKFINAYAYAAYLIESIVYEEVLKSRP